MFALVADIERYPEFVPLCKALRVRGRDTRPDGSAVLIADMTIAYKFIQETFTSRVTIDPANLVIVADYLDGPFRHMENRWGFRPIDETTCEVRFYIDYEFRSRTLAALMGAAFDRAFRKFSAAFEARADRVYGV